ncbi:hypothetical protein [Thauera phenylacetica]|jgi:diaminopimelate decarboxylase
MNETAKPQCAPLSGVAEALRRAALRARELAQQTHTPVVVYRNGKVQSQIQDASAAAGGAEPRQG